MGKPLPEALRVRLDAEPARALLEYLAGRLGLLDGHVRLEVVFAGGSLVKSYVHRGPVANSELEALALPEAAPLPDAAAAAAPAASA